DAADHWNPSISAAGTQVLYHRAAPDYSVPDIEPWGSPPGCPFKMLRVGGVFPVVSPDGQHFAMVSGEPDHLVIMNLDGGGRKTIVTAQNKEIFSLSWALKGDRIAFAYGAAFQTSERKTDVEIETIAADGSARKTLTARAGMNAFPAFSPDGKQL